MGWQIYGRGLLLILFDRRKNPLKIMAAYGTAQVLSSSERRYKSRSLYYLHLQTAFKKIRIGKLSVKAQLIRCLNCGIT
jgi:hypothetical protein